MAYTTRKCVVCGKWFTPFADPSAEARPHCGLLTPAGPKCFPCLDREAGTANTTFTHPGTEVVYVAVPIRLGSGIAIDQARLSEIATAVECILGPLCEEETDNDDWTMINDVTVYRTPEDATLDLTAARSQHG